MTPQQARDVLHARYEDRPWYRQTIVGDCDGLTVLYLMVATREDCHRSNVPYQVGGYSVLVRVDQPERFAGQYAG